MEKTAQFFFTLRAFFATDRSLRSSQSRDLIVFSPLDAKGL
jgi:hypothetical protein